jgi:nitrate reductase NapE component
MAKKSRTPAPPRKVQAPQKRTDPKRPRSPEDRRFLIMTMAFAAFGVVAVIVAGLFVFVFSGNDNATAKIPTGGDLIGLQTGPAPWNAGLDTLPDRLAPLGLHDLTNEGEVVHIHQHLDVFVNGKKVPVPAQIGIYGNQFLTELHTHDATGVMHVESPTKRTFDLAQFFGVWGVRLTPSCVGGYCKELTPWRLYVNGAPYQGDPRTLELKPHQELALVIGTPPAKIPSSYKFPAGL